MMTPSISVVLDSALLVHCIASSFSACCVLDMSIDAISAFYERNTCQHAVLSCIELLDLLSELEDVLKTAHIIPSALISIFLLHI